MSDQLACTRHDDCGLTEFDCRAASVYTCCQPGCPAPACGATFGCTRCADASRARGEAERMTGRLLTLLALSEAREARQRQEIGDLEQRPTHHLPKWQADA